MKGHNHSGETELKPAPGALRLLQEFVNTRDLEQGFEALSDGRGLESWLRRAGLIEGRVEVGVRDLEDAVALREAVRGLLVANNGEGPEPRAVETFNDLSRGLPIGVRCDEAGELRLRGWTDGVEGALGHLVGLILYTQADGTWERLKACRNDDCRWAFYDASKNRVGAWCDMATCGNRSKSRAHRERQKTRRTERS